MERADKLPKRVLRQMSRLAEIAEESMRQQRLALGQQTELRFSKPQVKGSHLKASLKELPLLKEKH